MRGINDLAPTPIECEEARWQFALPATVVVGDHSFAATLVNLSRSGLRLQTAVSSMPGTRIYVTVPHWPKLIAITLWMREGLLGAKFDALLRYYVLANAIKSSAGLDRLDGAVYI